MIAITPYTSQLWSVLSLMLHTLVVSLHLTTTPESCLKTLLLLKMLLFGPENAWCTPWQHPQSHLFAAKEIVTLINIVITVLVSCRITRISFRNWKLLENLGGSWLRCYMGPRINSSHLLLLALLLVEVDECWVPCCFFSDVSCSRQHVLGNQPFNAQWLCSRQCFISSQTQTLLDDAWLVHDPRLYWTCPFYGLVDKKTKV